MKKTEKISQTIAKRSDCHFEKNDLGDFGVDQYDKNVLVIRGLFVCSPFIWASQLSARPFGETHYEVKYSALYFTWKLLRNCARLLDKLLRIQTSNRLVGSSVSRYPTDADKEGLKNELHSGEDGKNESR